MQATVRTTIFGLILALPLLYSAAPRADTAEDLFRPYAELLKRHVVEHDLDSGGLISSFDYGAAITDPDSRELIDSQRKRLANLETAEFDRREAALAFWINAYNFFMIAHIVDNAEDDRPVESVKDFGNLFNPFRVFDRRLFNVAGSERALSEIELEILLGEKFAQRGWKDARVHFAVNCASVGCPALRQIPFSADNLDDMLDENTRRSLATPLHLKIDDDTARVTSLFDWYSDDFIEAAGSVRAFLELHIDANRRERLQATDETRFIDYDWRLNSPENMENWLEARK
jgi:hypothetical protein